MSHASLVDHSGTPNCGVVSLLCLLACALQYRYLNNTQCFAEQKHTQCVSAQHWASSNSYNPMALRTSSLLEVPAIMAKVRNFLIVCLMLKDVCRHGQAAALCQLAAEPAVCDVPQ
jgi:hypothetical protein